MSRPDTRGTRPRPRRARRALLASTGVLLALSAVVLSSGTAAAVTPRPTDDRSEVVAVPPGGVVSARVIGGDSLLAMTVAPGHEVVVEGYAGEPYLRVRADGSVEVNRNSAAVELNRARDADLGAAPTTTTGVDWQPYQSGRTAVWHDHRIHAGQGVQLTGPVDWQIPISVDGTDGVIAGRLDQLPSPSPLAALGVAVGCAALLLVLGRRRPLVAVGVALGVASAVAAVTGYLEWQSLPSVVARNAGLFLLPIGAAAALTVGVIVTRRSVRLVALLASVSLLAGWIAFRWSIVTRAVLISDLDPTIDRLALALVAGATVAAAGLVVNWAGT